MCNNGKCCGTCKHAQYDETDGFYVCVNDGSEYIADLVEYDHWCDDYEEE